MQARVTFSYLVFVFASHVHPRLRVSVKCISTSTLKHEKMCQVVQIQLPLHDCFALCLFLCCSICTYLCASMFSHMRDTGA